MAFRIGCDVGGTFTDLCLVATETGQATFIKIPTTPGNQATAVVAATRMALKEADAAAGAVAGFAHGTTVATNAIIERKGARTALLLTTGFRDLMIIARQMRPHLYDAVARKPAPLCPRYLTFEVPERIGHDGKVIAPLDEKAVGDIVARLKAEEVASVAVVLLHSYANPAHERRVGEILMAGLPDIDISLSADVLPEPGEYERGSTTLMNAYIMPTLRDYLGRLSSGLTGVGIGYAPVVMQSNGGTMTVATAGSTKSVHTCLSGPAAGLIGAAKFAEAGGFRNVVTVDMGGTSFDVGLIHHGEIATRYEGVIGGIPLRIPMFDIVTLGAGGGSIAQVDPGGMLRVGPESAGATPGPAAYGKGGTRPSVTDSNVVLGRLRDSRRFGGDIVIGRTRSFDAIEQHIATPLGMDVVAAADGIRSVVTAAMVRGIRQVTVERGLDPRDFALLAFGGAGPLHAVDLARELGIKTVIVPPSPGILCAIGLLLAPWRHDETMSLGVLAETLTGDKLRSAISDLSARALFQAERDQVPADAVTLGTAIDLRYEGQGHQIIVPLKNEDLEMAIRHFHEQHRATYGYERTSHRVEAVTLRLIASAPAPVATLPVPIVSEGDPVVGKAKVFIDGISTEIPVVDRSRLSPAARLTGPMLVEQQDTTVFVGSQTVTVDQIGNLIITVAP